MNERDRRNLNPRPTAVFAKYHWSADYGAQTGGAMDFYDSLHPHDQNYCNEAVTAIINAGLQWGVDLRAGRETARKPSPRLKQRRKKSVHATR